MNTKLIHIDGVELVVRDGYVPPADTIKAFPDCCGSGSGFVERLVPETIFGLRVSAACHIHDDGFEHAASTWADFHQVNYMFLRNLIAIIIHKSNRWMSWLRIARAGTFFYMVDVVGSSVFWALKKRQTERRI